MRQSSIVIHKGRKEEKYEIYVEDYVISFLKDKTSEEKITEIVFYGRREKGGRKYTIYGAGQDRHLAVFDKYDLLEEVECRLTQTEPVFLVREPGGVYEVKGYKVFYNDNEEMQEYLIQRDNEEHREYSSRSAGRTDGRIPGKNAGRTGRHIPGNVERTDGFTSGRNTGKKSGRIFGHDIENLSGRIFRTNEERTGASVNGRPHYAISLQLGVVFVVLVAIVINSSNSYHKMQQLNQSAAEVFFVMENQEAEETARTDEKEQSRDIVIEREQFQENMVQENVNMDMSAKEDGGMADSDEAGDGATEKTDENGEDADARPETDLTEENKAASPGEDMEGADSKSDSENNNQDENEIAQEQEGQEESRSDPAQPTGENAGEEEGVEALSRNVARYYEVKRGDTLYMISQKIYGDTAHVKKICELNQITDPDNIHYGQKIILP